MADNFDFFIAKGGWSETKKDALVAVGDTMFMGMMWLRQHELPETVENMVRFAELVLRYEVKMDKGDA